MAMDPTTGLPANYTTPQSTTPTNYMLPEAEQARRKMAMELMYGKGQTQQPEMKHWTQLLGNIGNSYLGNKMFNQANQQGRASDVHDTSTFEGGLWGKQKPPIPGVGGPAPFQASGPMPFSGGTPPPGTPPMPPPGGPPGVPPPPQMSPSVPPRGMPSVPFPGIGGLPKPEGWPQPPQQAGWPASLFNPQG